MGRADGTLSVGQKQRLAIARGLVSTAPVLEKAVRGEVHADTVWNLGFVAGPATSTFSLLALLFYLRYRINRRRHAEVVAELRERTS